MVIIRIIKEIEYTEQVMHSAVAHRSLTSSQPGAKQGPLASFPLSLNAEHEAVWSLWSAAVSCPGCVPFQLCCAPSAFLLMGHEKLKSP